jgi:threonine aldolase
LVAELARAGVKTGALGPRTVRAVTHLDVDAAGVERALDAVRAALASTVRSAPRSRAPRPT